MADKSIISTKDVWLTPDGKSAAPNAPEAQRHTIWVYDNGEIWEVVWSGDKQGDATYLDTDPQLASQFRAANKIESAAPTTRQAPTGAEMQWNPDTGQWEPAPGMPAPTVKPAAPHTWQNPMDGSVTDLSTGQQLSPAIPGWIPGRGVPAPQQAPQRAPRFPEEEALDKLQVQKAQRELANPFVLQQQQLFESINAIQEQIASGQITPQEGDRLLGLARSNLDAALQGTTPWQMEQSKRQMEETRRNNQMQLANSLVQNRGQLGGSLATGFLSGLGGIYGKILGSTNPPAINPLEMATNYTNQMYGGPEMSDLAMSLLRGYLSQGSPQGVQ